MPAFASSLRNALVLSAGLTTALPAKPSGSGPTCSDLVLPISINAENHQVPDYLVSGLQDAALTLTGLESLLNGVGNEVQGLFVNGTYNIAARFCEPEVYVESRHKAVQLLVHGITYDRNYWSGGNLTGYDGDKYSWIAHASKLGYPTLSIDRLGYGLSDHPDPILVVQRPAHVEVAHGVVEALRSGKVGGRAFSKVSFVGHSYGSLVGNGLAARYPGDIDALILTGFTNNLKPAIPGVLVTPLAQPAVLVEERFSNLTLGYMAMTLEYGARGLFYTNTESEWDADFLHFDWEHRGTFSVGEAVSTLFVNDVADDYTKPVLILTGHKDQIFCGLALPLLGEADCGEGENSHLEKTRVLFPNADFQTHDIPNTGHCQNFHYSANETFTTAHDFLAKSGF